MLQTVMQSFLVMCFLAAAIVPSQNAMESYQRGLVQEQAAGNLPQAIELYRRAAKEAGQDRALAAKALVRAAGSFRKLGRPEAATLYEEVLQTYPEQREPALEAQRQLAELRLSAPARMQSGSTDVTATAGAMVKTYCVGCHNQARQWGGVVLDSINTSDVAQDARVWENILLRLRSGIHPPAAWPDEATERSVILSLEAALDKAYAATAPLTGVRVSDAEFASRLAAFLWDASPDSQLNDAVRRGTLRDPDVIGQQVKRMLGDLKSSHFVQSFFAAWLRLADLASALEEPAVFPGFTGAQWADFTRETELFLQSQLTQDSNAIELLTADYTFVNERLAAHYGIPNVSGSEFRRVPLNGNLRAGILGHASILTMTSMPGRTSPTLRGKWVIETMLGVPLPPPPPNIPPLRDGPGAMRRRIEEATSDRRCSICHGMFDPFGFALENFDGRGRWRDTDSGEPVNAASAFGDGSQFNGPAEFRAALLKYRDAYLTNVTRLLLANALGRQRTRTGSVYPYEMAAVRAILREAAAKNYSWSALIAGVVKSAPFQMKNIVP